MTSDTLKDKTALITGASKRLGRETALALADEGVNVVVHYNTSEAEANKLAREIRDRGVKSWTIKADFNKREEYDTLIERTIQGAGTLDILVNNASIFPSDKIDNVTWGSFMTNMEVNAWVPFVLSRSFAQIVGRGKIVNMVDSRVAGYDWNHVAYIWSKNVLALMTRMMALEFASEITVNAVSPGLVLPPPGQDQSYLDRLTGTVPMKKHGEPGDVADAVVYLLKSSIITGQTIYVDGGRHLKEYSDG